jgi:hypothetical protein
MKFKEGSKIETGDFYYDLFYGGYIKPEDILVNKDDIIKVNNAIRVLEEFESSATEQGIIEDC